MMGTLHGGGLGGWGDVVGRTVEAQVQVFNVLKQQFEMDFALERHRTTSISVCVGDVLHL